MNVSDIITEFLDAIEAAGIRPLESIANALATGGIVRFATADKPKRQNGWAVLFLDAVPAGRFGAHHLGIDQKWRSGAVPVLSPADRAAMQGEWKAAAERRRQARHEAQLAAAKEAERLWAASAPVTPSHAYLVGKTMSGEGLRQSGNVLLVPMHDVSGKLWNIQRIAPDGAKRFLKDGRTDGLMFLTGSGGDTLCIGEGVATMAAIRAVTRHPVAAAFSAANLEPVARAVRAKWPRLDIVICADDDAHLVNHPTIGRNLGVEYAKAAAAAVHARLALPRKAVA